MAGTFQGPSHAPLATERGTAGGNLNPPETPPERGEESRWIAGDKESPAQIKSHACAEARQYNLTGLHRATGLLLQATGQVEKHQIPPTYTGRLLLLQEINGTSSNILLVQRRPSAMQYMEAGAQLEAPVGASIPPHRTERSQAWDFLHQRPVV